MATAKPQASESKPILTLNIPYPRHTDWRNSVPSRFALENGI